MFSYLKIIFSFSSFLYFVQWESHNNYYICRDLKNI